MKKRLHRHKHPQPRIGAAHGHGRVPAVPAYEELLDPSQYDRRHVHETGKDKLHSSHQELHHTHKGRQ